MTMSSVYGQSDEAESIATIRRAVDLGVSLVDTADEYGDGQNEELLGRALAGLREKVVLATKFGNLHYPDGTWGVNGRPEYVAPACEASLRRLKTDVIDLYYLHRVDPKVRIEDTVGAMSRLVEQGKVRHLGLSEAAPATLRRAHAVHPLTALQSEYSLWTRDMETDVLPACRELGVGFVAYCPLGRGFLGGKVREVAALSADDRRRRLPRYQEENFKKNLDLLEALEPVAAAHGCSVAQVALAWLLRQGVVPIPGTKRRAYVEENAAAAAVKLEEEEVERLSTAFAPGAVAGARYTPEVLKRVGL
jgi:aryl-alcohol dehydrogenase-like predicted oxidoreductase